MRQAEHTKHITTNTHNPDQKATNNTPEVTDDEIRRRYKKFINVKQKPLTANEIAGFKRILPNPTEEDIIEICKDYIKMRIEHTQSQQKPT